MKYRAEIDGLRAVAVVPVVLFHAGVASFRGGFVGVDVFFVISGYLITTIIVQELESGTFSVGRFYERRARRILPALFVVMAFSAVAAWFWLAPREMNDFSLSLASVVAFASNFFFWARTGYFDVAAELKPLLHTWSLAVEEQYYVVFPLLLMWLLRFGRRVLVPTLAIAAAWSLLLAESWSRTFPSASFFLLPTRLWELLIGSVCALVIAHPRIREARPAMRAALALLGLASLVGTMVLLDPNVPFPGLVALVPTLGTALIILCADRGNVVGRLLGHRVLVAVGLVSYSIYLWHQPLLAFARNLSSGELGTGLLIGICLFTGALAYLTWRFVEAPVRNRRLVTQRQLVSGSVVFGAAFVVFGALGWATRGFAELRTSATQERLLATMEPSPKRKACHATERNPLAPAESCEYFADDVRWAVLGDSHGVELAYAVARQLEPQGIGVKQFTATGCAPAYGSVGDKSFCGRWTADVVPYILAHARIETVVVSYRIDAALFGDHGPTFPRLPDTIGAVERERRWMSYIGLLTALREHGKRTVLVLQAPEASKDAGDLIFKYGRTGGDVVGVERGWWNRRNAFVNSRLAEIPPGVIVVDPASLLCDAESCVVSRRDHALYFDDNHLSLYGAALVAAEVVRRVGDVPALKAHPR